MSHRTSSQHLLKASRLLETSGILEESSYILETSHFLEKKTSGPLKTSELLVKTSGHLEAPRLQERPIPRILNTSRLLKTSNLPEKTPELLEKTSGHLEAPHLQESRTLRILNTSRLLKASGLLETSELLEKSSCHLKTSDLSKKTSGHLEAPRLHENKIPRFLKTSEAPKTPRLLEKKTSRLLEISNSPQKTSDAPRLQKKPSDILNPSRLQIILLNLLIFLKLTSSESAHECKCVLFNVTNGHFQSPEFPAPLDKSPCLFYHFQAPPDHIIRLTFDIFHLPTRIGVCSSSIMLFDHSQDGLIELDERADFEFCGKEIPSGRQFYSKHEHFLLKISTGKEASRGFQGSFLAIPKKNFTSDAVEMAECSYRVEKQKAIIYSPEYPYYYPSKVNCTYHIPQRKGFQIIINSLIMDLGRDAILQIFESVEGKFEKRLIEMVTNGQKSLFVSSTSSILIYFSAGTNDVDRSVGFVIELQYSNAVWRSQSPETTSECQLNVNSENFKEGQLSSDKIGRFASSSMPTKCQVVFQGYPNEKISIHFTHFNLYVPDNKNVTKRCAEVDNLSADVRVGSRLSRIDEWCGKRSPPNLMSSSNLLQLEYNTKSSKVIRDSANNDIGFRLEYKFHTDWNMSSMKAKVDKKKECRFSFNSSEHTNGKLWSANYPGLYPRNLYCEYIFHGRNDQVVHIHFEYFDIEGFNQCDETTQSDYILFSNYQTHDRTNRRFCGKTAPKGPILSESNYFRMIFSTNDIFDATGFYAHYQFITQEKSQISRVKLTISSSQMIFSTFSSFSLIFSFFLAIVIFY